MKRMTETIVDDAYAYVAKGTKGSERIFAVC
jgi:hypothetical protein